MFPGVGGVDSDKPRYWGKLPVHSFQSKKRKKSAGTQGAHYALSMNCVNLAEKKCLQHYVYSESQLLKQKEEDHMLIPLQAAPNQSQKKTKILHASTKSTPTAGPQVEESQSRGGRLVNRISIHNPVPKGRGKGGPAYA